MLTLSLDSQLIDRRRGDVLHDLEARLRDRARVAQPVDVVAGIEDVAVVGAVRAPGDLLGGVRGPGAVVAVRGPQAQEVDAIAVIAGIGAAFHPDAVAGIAVDAAPAQRAAAPLGGAVRDVIAGRRERLQRRVALEGDQRHGCAVRAVRRAVGIAALHEIDAARAAGAAIGRGRVERHLRHDVGVHAARGVDHEQDVRALRGDDVARAGEDLAVIGERGTGQGDDRRGAGHRHEAFGCLFHGGTHLAVPAATRRSRVRVLSFGR